MNQSTHRQWKCVYINSKVVDPQKIFFQISLTSRTDGEMCCFIPDVLYGSIRYGLSQYLSIPHLGDTNIIMTRLQILDAVKGTEIKGKKEKLLGKNIIDGTTETSMHLMKSEEWITIFNDNTRWQKADYIQDKGLNNQSEFSNYFSSFGQVENLFKSNSLTQKLLVDGQIQNDHLDCYSASTKIKFLDVSSSYEGSPFSFLISYFDPRNLDNPILVIQSAPFKVYARRKRKREEKKKSSSNILDRDDFNLESEYSSLSGQDAMSNDTNSFRQVKRMKDSDADQSNSMEEFQKSIKKTSKNIDFTLEINNNSTTFNNDEKNGKNIFNDYISEFDELMSIAKKMNPDERKLAIQKIFKSLISFPLNSEFDPHSKLNSLNTFTNGNNSRPEIDTIYQNNFFSYNNVEEKIDNSLKNQISNSNPISFHNRVPYLIYPPNSNQNLQLSSEFMKNNLNNIQ